MTDGRARRAPVPRRALDAGTAGKRNGQAVLLEAADLTTHGVIVGMTGSGKTASASCSSRRRCSQGIPTLILDPKGDLGNLLLTFPELRPDDFAPWVESGDPAEVADAVAGRPRRLGHRRRARRAPARRRRVHDLHARLDLGRAAQHRRRAAPAGRGRRRRDRRPTRSRGSCPACSAMVGVDADPLSGREHILLVEPRSQHAWAAGQDLDLAGLVGPGAGPAAAQARRASSSTPSSRPSDRTTLACRSTGCWPRRRSPPGPRGPTSTSTRCSGLRPDGPSRRAPSSRCRHLSDEERQFVVSLVLGKLDHLDAPPARHRPAAGARVLRRGDGVRAARRRTRRRRSRSSRCSSRPAPSASASCSPRRTRSTSTTRASPTPARG